jgi:hypothetical protein
MNIEIERVGSEGAIHTLELTRRQRVQTSGHASSIGAVLENSTFVEGSPVEVAGCSSKLRDGEQENDEDALHNERRGLEE